MRVESPARSKTGRVQGGTTKDGLPVPGTKTRRLYDTYQANKGIPINNAEVCKIVGAAHMGKIGYIIQNLTDFWGLDIRSYPDCHHKCLVGEWIGRDYVDYLASKME